MAFDGIRSIEWYAHNEVRAYPLAVTASGVSTDGLFHLPNSAILAVYVHLPWSRDIDPSRFFISRLANVGGFLEVTISYKPPSTAAVAVATSRVVLQASDSPSVRELAPLADWLDVAGSVTFGTRSSLGTLPLGVFDFAMENTQLEVDCVRPSARNLTGLLVESAQESFELATGVVNLRAGANIRFRVQETDGGGRDLWIDAIDGANLNVDCECGDVLTNPVRTLNGIQPNVNGNIDINGAKCLNIEGATGVLSMDNPCSTPCCGCEEAEALQEAINLLGPQINTLANFAPRLAAQMDRIEFFVRSTDISEACDAAGNSSGGVVGGLPTAVVTTSTTSTTSTTTTTTAITGLAMAAIELLHAQVLQQDAMPSAGFAVDADSAGTYAINFVYAAVAGEEPAGLDWAAWHPGPLTNCTIENCGDITLQPIASATSPTIQKRAVGYHLTFTLNPEGPTSNCSQNSYDPDTPYTYVRVIGRVYVPAPVYADIDAFSQVIYPQEQGGGSEFTRMVVGDSINWRFRHRSIITDDATYDLTALPADTLHHDVLSGIRARVDSQATWCVGAAWNSANTFNGVLHSPGNGYLLHKGWHDVIVDVRRSPRPRNEVHTIHLSLRTRLACRAVGPTVKEYKLVLMNYGSNSPRTFSLTVDAGTISPTSVPSSSVSTVGVDVAIEGAATTITATSGSLVITVPLNSIPARAAWTNTHLTQPSPVDNYTIELNSPPTCP